MWAAHGYVLRDFPGAMSALVVGETDMAIVGLQDPSLTTARGAERMFLDRDSECAKT
jgi:hypothetical protein